MKKQLQRFRKFFVRTKRMNATTARPAMNAYDDEDDGSTRLSSAFIVVLLLHVVAVVGVIAFTRIKENRKSSVIAATAAATATTSVASSPEPQPQLETPARQLASLAPVAPDLKASVPPPTLEDSRPAAATTVTQSGGRIHTVKSGENLTKIAMAYGVTASELAFANTMKSDEVLRIGMKLEIPEKKTTVAKAIPVKKPDTTVAKAATAGNDIYVVQKGDNPVKIARELGVSYEELVKLNNIKDPKKIQPGLKLKVPNKQG